MQKKSVIYIDVEDDITAIIGKVKDAKEKIVALVPPKRTGVLQSAVNMRLLARTADNADKRLVIITGNAALTALAANAQIPVAKTLQSQPKLAELDTDDTDIDEEDMIDGASLPVGDHARLKDDDDEEEIIVPADLDSLDMEGDDEPSKKPEPKQKSKKNIKVPDFGTFRKKLVFGIGGGVLLVLFLIWAIVIAPHATVVVSAKTSPVEVGFDVKLGDALTNDFSKKTLSSITQTDKKTQEIEFEATGKKDVGTKASGTVIFSNCETRSPNTQRIEAGTYLSSGGMNYVVQSTVDIPGGNGPGFVCVTPGQSTPVKVVAEDIGDEFNTAAGAQFTVAGFGSTVTASSANGLTGGEKHNATVVTASDVQKAREQISEGNDSDAVKEELKAKFSEGVKIIDESFTASFADPKLEPGIGEELKGDKAKMTVEVTYSMTAVANDAFDEFLKSAVNESIGDDQGKRIYDSGAGSAQFSDFKLADNKKTATVHVLAKGQVGIKIDDNQIKDQVKGKRSGEVIGDIKAIDGVSDVDVKLSPFWVSGVPDDVNKITIEFKLITNG